jgi:hypothetical protein
LPTGLLVPPGIGVFAGAVADVPARMTAPLVAMLLLLIGALDLACRKRREPAPSLGACYQVVSNSS